MDFRLGKMWHQFTRTFTNKHASKETKSSYPDLCTSTASRFFSRCCFRVWFVCLLLRALVCLFVCLLACLLSFFLSFFLVCFLSLFLRCLRFWQTGWLTDRLTYILPCWFSLLFLLCSLLLFCLGHATHQHTYPFAEVFAVSMCPLIAFPTCHPHPFESSSISIRTAVYPSMQITQFPASCYFVCHTSQKNCYQHAFRAWVPEKRGWTDFAANPPFCRWSLRFGSFWRQTGAPQGHPYPPVKSKYLNGISRN